jgi:hypothetical protein
MKFTIVLTSLAVLFTSALALPVEQNLGARDIIDLSPVVAREPTIIIDARDYLDDLEIYARGNKPAKTSVKELNAFCTAECKEGGFTPGTKPFGICMKTCCMFFFPSRLC